MQHDEQAAQRHSAKVQLQLELLRAKDEAQQIFAKEKQPQSEPFDAGTLREILSRPPEPPMRIAGLQPWHSSILLSAQRKTGKTTMLGNWARSLLTGDPFLGRHEVKPLDGKVGILNFEVSGAQIARWLDDTGVPRDRCIVVNLRGRRNPLKHPEDRFHLATYLNSNGIEALAVDPFGRAYTGDSQNDNGEVGAWLVDLEVFARAEVGADELLLTAHAGWEGERTRGASALEDWPDAIWGLTRPNNHGQGNNGPRYFRALGRDVDLEEDELSFDPVSRRLSLTGVGSRQAAEQARQDEETREQIIELLEAQPSGLSGSGLAHGTGRKDAGFTRVRDGLVAEGVITQERRTGRGGGMVYRLALPTSRNIPKLTDSAGLEPTEPPLYESGGSKGEVRDPNLPRADR